MDSEVLVTHNLSQEGVILDLSNILHLSLQDLTMKQIVSCLIEQRKASGSGVNEVVRKMGAI
jgi:hypothetical protein